MRSCHISASILKVTETLLIRSCHIPANTPRLTEARAKAQNSALAKRSSIFYNMFEALRGSPRPVLITKIPVLDRAYCKIWWSEARGRLGVL